MTRNFDKRWRDDSRPSFHNQSSSDRYREERPSRPGRPRLNRETVDRAWENGAQHTHADYRTRTNNQRPAPGNGRRGYQQQPFGSRYSGPNGPRTDSYNRRTYQDGPPSYGPKGSSYTQYPDSNRRSYERPDREQDNFRKPYNSRPGRRPASSYGRDNGFRGQGPRQNQASGRGYHNAGRQNGYSTPSSYDGHFEGDYERFNEDPYPSNRPTSRRRETRYNDRSYGAREQEQAPRELHVTRLPDGRVLKGSRPAQREQAAFWTGIEQDTEELLDTIESPEATPETTPEKRPEKKNAYLKARAKQTSSSGPRSGARQPKPTASRATRGRTKRPIR
ncbi:hypothetical protein EPA93_43135 [Ktedonosporobacter rubrisoli]|uniref:Uncharacterized protein n=1 Tax=Ktedonosporobacter rubrisoli TaxID=2509675 RepID=A0A4V0Z092_KTERU|nr:hypothetical protein [Ktedonosporobacter rubrisoli]QBD82411.1 hypothetical protein EPA93_43135 [Ktedonosporobacter rubrisoli]